MVRKSEAYSDLLRQLYIDGRFYFFIFSKAATLNLSLLLRKELI